MRKPMNGNRVDLTFRKKLLGKKMELLTSLGFNFKRLAAAERNSEEDLIVALRDEFLHLGLDRVMHEQLREVESALDRLNSGEYGDCARCGNSISSKRLQAIPWATYCVDCKGNAFDGQPHETASLVQELR